MPEYDSGAYVDLSDVKPRRVVLKYANNTTVTLYGDPAVVDKILNVIDVHIPPEVESFNAG